MLPKLFINTLSLLCFLRTFIQASFRQLGFPYVLVPRIYWPSNKPEFRPISASIIQDMIGPGLGSNIPEQCVICMLEFRDNVEIRRLTTCRHIFHRGCLDRWMEHDQITCPLCRTPFVPDELMAVLHGKPWTAATSAIPEFGGEFCLINNML